MNDNPLPLLAASLSQTPRSTALSLWLVVLLVVPVSANTITWDGDTNTDFTDGNNWAGGLPPANSITTDFAAFTAATTFQPSLAGAYSVTGISFAGGFTFSGAGTLTIGASGFLTNGTNTISVSSIKLGTDATVSLSGNTTITSGINNNGFALTLTRNTNTATTPLDLTNTVISGAGAVTFDNASSSNPAITLGGANTFTGAVLVQRALVNFSTLASGGTNSSFGAGTGDITMGGAGSNAGITNVGAGGSTDRLLKGNTSGNVNINNNGTGALNFNNTGTFGSLALTLNGSYIGSANAFTEIITGAATLTKAGASTWTLTAANTFTGAVTISAGVLETNTIAAAGTASGVGQGTLFNLGGTTASGTLRYIGATSATTDRVVNLSGSTGPAILDQSATSGLLKFTGNLTATSLGTKVLTLTGSTAGAGEFAGVIANNTTSGTTALTAGFSSGATTVSVTTNTLTGVSVGATVTGAGIQAGTTVTLVSGNTATLSLPTNGTALSGQALTFSGAVNTVVGVTKTGTGTWTLSNANTYTGITTVNTGTLIGTNTQAFGDPTTNAAGQLSVGGTAVVLSLLNNGTGNNGTITYGGPTASATGYNVTATNPGGLTFNVGNNGANTGNTIKLGALLTNQTLFFTNSNGYNLSFGAVTSTSTPTITNNMVNGTLTWASFNSSSGGNPTLNFNGASATAITAVGAISGSSVLKVTQSGSGTLLLQGTNTYTGATTVSAGTLQVGSGGIGSTAAGSAVSVNGTGAVLAGTGTISGATTVTNGTVRPGDSAGTALGTLNTANLTVNGATATAVVETQLTADTSMSSDKINSSGTITFSNGSHLTVTVAPTVAGTWDLLDWATAFNFGNNILSTTTSTGGTIATTGTGTGSAFLDLQPLSGNLTYDLTNFISAGQIIVATPEPTRALLTLLGLVALSLRRRRIPSAGSISSRKEARERRTQRLEN